MRRSLFVGILVIWLAAAAPAGATVPCAFSGGVGPQASDGAGRPRSLVAVRAGGHRCFDRATFELASSDGEPVGYRVQFEPAPIREDGSGRAVPVAGDAFIVVRLSPARDVDLSGGHPRPTYSGPTSLRPAATDRIVEVRRVSGYEATVKWVIGLDHRRPFRVVTLTSPPRVVVDVR